MKICRIQPEKINVNGKIITIENGEIVNSFDLTPKERKKLWLFLNDNQDIDERIIIVSELYRVEISQVLSKARGNERVAEARQYAMWMIKTETKKTLKDIGRMFNRTHATVYHAVNVINDRIETHQLLINETY